MSASAMTDAALSTPATGRGSASGLILLTLAAGQFVMTLDTSVMNVSMVQVANDVGTDISGIQLAITLYTLVMATLMITGGKIGQIIGRPVRPTCRQPPASVASLAAHQVVIA